MTTTINFKIDTKMKKSFEDFTSQLGIPMSTLINMFINKTIKDQAVPFKLELRNDEYDRLQVANKLLHACGSLKDMAKDAGFNSYEDVFDWWTNERRKNRRLANK